jgi:hypothetical protein
MIGHGGDISADLHIFGRQKSFMQVGSESTVNAVAQGGKGRGVVTQSGGSRRPGRRHCARRASLSLIGSDESLSTHCFRRSNGLGSLANAAIGSVHTIDPQDFARFLCVVLKPLDALRKLGRWVGHEPPRNIFSPGAFMKGSCWVGDMLAATEWRILFPRSLKDGTQWHRWCCGWPVGNDHLLVGFAERLSGFVKDHAWEVLNIDRTWSPNASPLSAILVYLGS